MTTMGLERVRKDTTFGVDLMRDQLKMVGPNAVADSTEVIPLKSLEGLANEIVVSKGSRSLNGELPIALSASGAQPKSATIGSAGINLRPETETTLFRGILGRHRSSFCGVMGPGADTLRPLSIVQGGPV